jgi:hypothetical protein
MPSVRTGPGQDALGSSETKLLTHAIRMSAYNTEASWPGYCARTTPEATTKPAPCYAKRSP